MASKFGATPVEAFGVGDHGVFSVVRDDVTVGVEGTVAEIRVAGKTRALMNGSGYELVRYDITKPRTVYAIMIKRHNPTDTALFDD